MINAPMLTRGQIEYYFKLNRIFMPYAAGRQQARYPNLDGSSRFAHYTSAEAALEIIRSKRIWMRNLMCMSDFREVHHGFQMLTTSIDGMNAIKSALEECLPGAYGEAVSAFDTRWPDIQFHTHVTSASEHDPEEDLHGRLSMWRAFGSGGPRVALIFNIPWLSSATQALGLVFSPVAYMDREQVSKELEKIAENIKANASFLRECPRQEIVGFVFTMFLTGVTCLKHPGFHEEREWRAIHGVPPLTAPLYMHPVLKCVNGIPQKVYEIPLDVSVGPDLADLDFARIFDRLIIGPTQYPVPMGTAFREALDRAGVPDALSKVRVSEIPIRT